MSHSRDTRALDEDRDFLAKMKAGDGEAFNVLVSAYAEMIYNVNLLVVTAGPLSHMAVPPAGEGATLDLISVALLFSFLFALYMVSGRANPVRIRWRDVLPF